MAKYDNRKDQQISQTRRMATYDAPESSLFILVHIYFAVELPQFLPNLTEITNHILGVNLKHAIIPCISFFPDCECL